MQIVMGMMKTPNEPLQYPPHYPPTDRWKKFFIGVRWLGPDLSFFKDLRRQQGARTSECMKAWGSTAQEELASVFGRAFKKKLRWPTSYFLPKDKFVVIAHGPKFDMIDNSELLEEVIEEVENYKGNRFPLSFWQASFAKTLGEVVNEILGMQDGA
jgi:hypothetical protein